MRNVRFWIAGAAFWGYAEATFFFIVPDILLTAAVLVFGLWRTLRLALVAAASAAIGGCVMWILGADDVEMGRAFLLSVPLIGDDLLMRVQSEITGAWPVNLTLGAITGAPYKIYAVEAGAANVNAFLFLVVSFIARALRFALSIGLAGAGFALARRVGLGRFNAAGLAFAWATIYAAYVSARLHAG